jgi:hypothetical protein
MIQPARNLKRHLRRGRAAVVKQVTQRLVASLREAYKLLARQMQALTETFTLISEDQPEESRVVRVIELLRDSFLHDLLEYLYRQEQELFPMVAQLPGGFSKVAQLRREYGNLRGRVEDFKSAWLLEAYAGPQTRQALLGRVVSEAGPIKANFKSLVVFQSELVRELNGCEVNKRKPAESYEPVLTG